MRLARVFGLVLIGTALSAGQSAAQSGAATLRVEPELSLAWWQVNPHLNHLWATTCPGDPSWRAGEGRSMAWAGEFLRQRSKTGYANVRDTIIPLYPRRRARPLCPDAVNGEVTVADTTTWRGVQGTIAIKGDQLVTGLAMRDEYSKKAILKTATYPEIKFMIDSLSSLQARGDTLRGRVYGKLQMLGSVPQPATAPLKAWHEAGGLRVQAQFMIPAEHMTEIYGISKVALGLGVGTNIWDELHLGVDAVLKPTGS
jgi:hypothetical protein